MPANDRGEIHIHNNLKFVFDFTEKKQLLTIATHKGCVLISMPSPTRIRYTYMSSISINFIRNQMIESAMLI